eukprot:55154_1
MVDNSTQTVLPLPFVPPPQPIAAPLPQTFVSMNNFVSGAVLPPLDNPGINLDFPIKQEHFPHPISPPPPPPPLVMLSETATGSMYGPASNCGLHSPSFQLPALGDSPALLDHSFIMPPLNSTFSMPSSNNVGGTSPGMTQFLPADNALPASISSNFGNQEIKFGNPGVLPPVTSGSESFPGMYNMPAMPTAPGQLDSTALNLPAFIPTQNTFPGAQNIIRSVSSDASQFDTNIAPNQTTGQFETNIAPIQATGQFDPNIAPNQTTGQFDINIPPHQTTGQFDTHIPPHQVTGQFDPNIPPHQTTGQFDTNIPSQQTTGQFDTHISPHQATGKFDANIPPRQVTGQFDINIPPHQTTGQFVNLIHIFRHTRYINIPPHQATGQFDPNIPPHQTTGQFDTHISPHQVTGQFDPNIP